MCLFLKKITNIFLKILYRPGRGTSKQFFSKHARSLRPSLKEGTVAVVLAGAHKGKRVLVLKQLASGLVLITGKILISRENKTISREINPTFSVK